MTFLAPWALWIGGVTAAGMVALHLVSRHRPAAYFLPTTRFIPDRQTLASRAATRPSDLPLLALRVLLSLVVGLAFARPILMPARGTMGRVVLVDVSSAVADVSASVARARALSSNGRPVTIIAFDSMAAPISLLALDSATRAPRSGAVGSLSAALVAARRAGADVATRVDSVQLLLISPVVESES